MKQTPFTAEPRTGADQPPVRSVEPRASLGAGGASLSMWAAIAVAGLLTGLGAGVVFGQPPFHYLQSADLPPGAIGAAQLLRGGPLPGYFQPVEIRVPDGAAISLSINGQYETPVANSTLAAMLIGQVYRFKVSGIPRHEGFEVYPTIEVINRLYPPKGLQNHFPIPIELTEEELGFALSGRFVTRVIYLEDPANALPLASQPNRQFYYEVRPDEDALQVADRLGRPIAILRMGSRVPSGATEAGLEYYTPPLLKLTKPAPLPPPRSGLEPAVQPAAGSRGNNIPRQDPPTPPQRRMDSQPVLWLR